MMTLQPVLAFAWNPAVGIPMLIVGLIVLALIWLFGQPKKEPGARRASSHPNPGERREPSLADDAAFDPAFNVSGPRGSGAQQGELDMVLGAVAHTPSEGILVKRLLDVEVTAYCCRSNSLARRREALTAAKLVPRRWVINRSNTQIVERLNHFFSDQLLAEPEVAMEIDSLIAGFMVVSGTELLVPAPTIVRTFAEAQGLVMLQLVEPLWKFRSGAWFPKSLERYAVLRRSLKILEDLVSVIPSGYGVTQK